jgi:hypothetical protein
MTTTWDLMADSAFYNSKSDSHSAQFHSRPNSLKITKYLFNYAVYLKRLQKKIKSSKKVVFKYANKTAHKIKYENGKRTDYYYLNKSKTAFYDKKKNVYDTNYKRSQDLIDFLNGKQYTATIHKRNNNQNDIHLNMKIKTIKDQYRALIGLSLHTIQDYYAHKVKVYKYKVRKNAYKKASKISTINCEKNPIDMTYFNTEVLKVPTLEVEDNKEFFSWRYNFADNDTIHLVRLFLKRKIIKSIKSYVADNLSRKFYVYFKKDSNGNRYDVHYQSQKQNGKIFKNYLYDKYKVYIWFTYASIRAKGE